MLRRGPSDGDHVFLTFDDGPDRDWTPLVLDILAAAGLHATFFVIGSHVRANPLLARRIADEGHQLGNHTATHRHPWMMSAKEARTEVRDGGRLIADITGTRPRYYRPPHGRLRRCMVESALEDGQVTVLWSLSAVDWGPMGRTAAIRRRLHRAAPGDIVLMHDGRPGPNRPRNMIAVLPEFLQALPRRGLAAATLPEAVRAVGLSRS